MDAREEFLRTYSDLPLKTREEIIVIIDGRPLSWNVAYKEIKENTRMGEQILKKLKSMDIL